MLKNTVSSGNRGGVWLRIKKDFIRNRTLYLLVLPVLMYYTIFHYKTMYGAVIAFQDYVPRKGIAGSEWVGLVNFIRFFQSPYFWRLIKNTVLISFYGLIFGFPAPIILALMLNEVHHKRYKKTIQTITYLPHFISLVVVTGMIKDFTQSTGLINDLIVMLGGTRSSLLQNPDLYRTIYITSDIWQGIGWGAIIYLSALAGVDQQLYEAASIDGAGRFRQIINVSLPCIAPTIIILLIMRMGQLLGTGYEKTILLYNEAIYEKADVIASYIYRTGILERNWSYSTAIGLFNSAINLVMIIMANKISKKLSETSLW